MLSLVGPWTMGAGLALIAAGSVLMAWTPKLKNTNEALLIASKHDNRLTAPRLALEMDISFEKAERIIRELVKAGIAEVDIDSRNPDQGIVYLIKGL
jgi:predicted HTH transcriptional regulator